MNRGPVGSVREIDTDGITARDRYHLLTSLVVPRPIGWISTWDAEGGANLAPYSFFAALAATPMFVGVSIGQRAGQPKDTLVHIRARRGFCVNVVSEPFLDAMNATSAEVATGVDEFSLAGLERATSSRVDAPYVKACPAVLECVLHQEVELQESSNTLVIGKVVGVRLGGDLDLEEGVVRVPFDALRPVGRLSGTDYLLPRATRGLDRP